MLNWNDQAVKRELFQLQFVNWKLLFVLPVSSSIGVNATPPTRRYLHYPLESLAKMRLTPFATGRDIDEALRLFKGSTMAAASAGALSGVEGNI